MRQLTGFKAVRACVVLSAGTLLSSVFAMGMVTANTRTFTAGEKAKVQGVIISKQGNTLKVRGDDDSIGTIDLSDTTKIELKKGGLFHRKSAMDVGSLVPGLHIEADGKGNDKGDLEASKVVFDPNSMRASKQIDTVVGPIEARTGTLESKTNQLENGQHQLESRANDLENTEKQTQQQVGQVQTQVGQVKSVADQANQGVGEVNTRVSNLDNYVTKDSTTVYFKINSATLTPDAKKDLDELAQKALNEKGYVVEVAGFADKTGPAAFNQKLSEERANAVIQYLEEQGNIPIHRILTPAGLGTSHEAAANNTAAGRKLNRRVEVKVLVNQGVVGGASTAANTETGTPHQ
jgi:outer membrane protein OmpA-like peptidoglycan-associated protein